MAVFNYVAVTMQGKTRKGILEGDSPSHIRKLLNERDLTPIEIIPVAKETQEISDSRSKTFRYLLEHKRRVSLSHLSVMTYQFSALLSASMTVEAALSSLAAEITNKTFKQVLLSVRSRVIEGHTLAYGMNDFPNVFPKLYVASVAIGEKTGQLDVILRRLADYYEKQRAVREKILQALIYPILLTVVTTGIIIFLLTYVIPQVTSVFIQSDQPLPGVTILLLSIIHFLQAYGLYTLLFIIIVIGGFRYALRYPHFRFRVHRFLLSIPVLKNTIIAVNAARFSRTFSILLAAGVPVIDAMTSANSIINLLPMKEAIADAIIKVGEGSSLYRALQQTAYFSSLTTQLIASGEATGELEIMLEKAASFQEQNTASKLNLTLSLFEPILILTMGSIVLFIVLAVLLPIFEMNQLIH